MRHILAPLVILLIAWSAAAQQCVDGGRCEIDNGYYLASAPPDWDGNEPLPVIVFYHGWNSSPEATFRNRAMLNAAHKRGALFVAPFAQSGYWRQIGKGRAERGRDELAYAHALMADLEKRWPIDSRMILASGFSRGASMVWNLACYAGDLFSGFAPIAGAFWGTLPGHCPSGPANIRHIHGLSDRVVALDEQGVYNSVSITRSIAFVRHDYQCQTPQEVPSYSKRLSCKASLDCSDGAVIELCTHPKGHSIPAEWVAEGLDWLGNLSRDY